MTEVERAAIVTTIRRRLHAAQRGWDTEVMSDVEAAALSRARRERPGRTDQLRHIERLARSAHRGERLAAVARCSCCPVHRRRAT